MQVQRMMSAHPHGPRKANDALLRCIERCYACAQTCTGCADACLAELAVGELRQCIRLALDCADICATIGRIVTRGTGLNESLLAEIVNICALVCRFCAAECDRHADSHDQCRICAAACRDCADACGEAILALRGSG